MIIFVKLETGASGIPLTVTPATTISDIKTKIRTEIGVSTTGQLLLYGGKTLEDNRTLGDYSIQTESALHLVTRCNGGLIQVFIKTLGVGNTTALQVDPTGNVSQLKNLIFVNMAIPVESQRLMYGGKQLEDRRKLEEYNIVPESAIYLIFRVRGGGGSFFSQKLINHNGAKSFLLKMVGRDKYAVKDLKIKIFCVMNIPEQEQRLYYNGRLLQDDKMLTDYRMHANSAITVVTDKEYF